MKCQLCGEKIKDISKGAVVLPWGETCENCLEVIKKSQTQLRKAN